MSLTLYDLQSDLQLIAYQHRQDPISFACLGKDADSEEILGAAILGIGGDECVHSLLDVMYAKAPYTTILRAVHIHPTVTELIPTMLGDLEPLGPA